MAQQTVSPTRKFILRNVILSYPNLVVPQKDNQGNLKYGAAFVTTPQTNISDLAKAELAAAADKYGADEAKEMLEDGALKSTWRRSKADVKKVGAPQGFINARSSNKPGCINRDKTISYTDEQVKTELYPGCLVNVSLYAFTYDNSGNRGVTFGLNNIQKVADGKRLDNRKSAEEEFDAVLDDPQGDGLI